ncbi:MAG: sigma-70 family RNA polymerase sigma factor [Pyrinomonadaceae bacterium]|nr:sigma-70 family RNA polymerase sigma factor [Pyrinomonadaceae bacterium]
MTKLEAARSSLFLVVGRTQSPEESTATEISSDAPLVVAAQSGDREAFAQLHSSYAPIVHGVLLARAPRNEVDDLVQDVFLQAFRKLHTLRDANTFGAWLATIARNRAVDFHRRARADEELSEENAVRSADEAKAEEILGVIRRLPEAYRETLVLRLVEGLTGAEIAARTNLTPASVRVNLHRGMKLLREQLGGSGV